MNNQNHTYHCHLCKREYPGYAFKSTYNEDRKKLFWCPSCARNVSQKESKVKNKSVVDEDEKFYRYLWKTREHYCAECGNEIKEFNIDRFHHILPKHKGAGGCPYFRHEERNVIMLCGKFGCHGKAESAISYPKMNIFPFCESMKAILLSEVGLTYQSKIA